MSLPEFTATASLYRTRHHYQQASAELGSRATSVRVALFQGQVLPYVCYKDCGGRRVQCPWQCIGGVCFCNCSVACRTGVFEDVFI